MQYQTIDGRTYYHFEECPGDKPKPPRRHPDGQPASTLEKYSKLNERRFWRRQFGGEVTRLQKGFDWTFGVFLPLACFYFDPLVFRSTWERDGGFLHSYQVFAYSLGFISVLAMAAWLLWGEQLRWLTGWLAGLFLAASIVSFAVGLALLPLSILGMAFLIGFLGYTPLLSGLIYLRNGVRATRAAGVFIDRRALKHLIVLSGTAAIALPWVLNQLFR